MKSTNTTPSKRLTRSTYIGEPISPNGKSNNRKARSSSTDSENGWIPPPPLLPLNTKFLFTNPQPYSQQSLPPLSPLNADDSISTRIAIAHLKCHPSNHSNHPSNNSHNLLSSSSSPTFKILSDHEIIKPPLSASQNQDDGSEFIFLETKFFNQRHRQPEMIEKRSKKLEKEKLLHERFKLKNRLDVLVKGSGADWKSVRTLTLKRIKEDEMRERSLGDLQSQSNLQPRETESEKVEKMRHIMIRETEEILKRYEKLLDTRKVPKPIKSITRSNETELANSSLTPSNTLPNKSSKTAKRKSTQIHHASSDLDLPNKKSTKLTRHQPTSSSKLKNSTPSATKHEHHVQQPAHSKCNLPNHHNDQRSSSPTMLPKLSASEPCQSGQNDDFQTLPSSCPARSILSRESLYESASIRRLAMDEQFVNGQRRVGRSTYALGCKLADLNQIQLDYLPRLQSMPSEKHLSSHSTPFDRPERKISVIKKPTSPTTNLIHADDDEINKDWIEFNPTVNEEKEIIAHQAEFGLASKFFDLDSELEYLEEQKLIEFENRQSAVHNKNPGSHLDQQNAIGGKSIRQLIQERIESWKN